MRKVFIALTMFVALASCSTSAEETSTGVEATNDSVTVASDTTLVDSTSTDSSIVVE